MLVGKHALTVPVSVFTSLSASPVRSECCRGLQRRGSHDKDPDKLAKVTPPLGHHPYPPPARPVARRSP